MTQPLLHLLHARGERITVAALPWVAPVYQAMPDVAEVLELPFTHGGLQCKARWSLGKHLRGQFDVAYVCPNSWKSALLPYWAHIPKRIAYRGEARWGLLTHALPNPDKRARPPMVSFYGALGGAGLASDARPLLHIPRQQIEETLAAFGLAAGAYYVLAPGSEYGPAKRWPARHFAALAQQLALPSVLLGSAKEEGVCAEIAVAVDTHSRHVPCMNLAGRTSLWQAFAIIAAAKAVVSNDSGLMHVAAALGVHQVALFGSSSPLHTPPLSAQAQVLWLKNEPQYHPALDCAPCFQRECPLGHTRCLNDIQPAAVLQLL